MSLGQLQHLVHGGPVEVSVGGEPLSTVIARCVAALNEQNDALSQLREYTYATNREQWDRISTLEGHTSELQRDVGQHERPLVPGTATVADAIRALDQRTATLNRQRQGLASMELLDKTRKLIASDAFAHWMSLTRCHRTVRMIFGTNANCLRSRYFASWRRSHALRRHLRSNARKVAGLVLTNTRSVLRARFSAWQQFRDGEKRVRAAAESQLQEVSEKMRVVSLRSHTRARFLDWQDFTSARVRRAQLHRVVLAMEQASLLAVARRAFNKLAASEAQHRQTRVRAQMSSALSLSSMKEHGRLRFRTWLAFVRRRALRLQHVSLVFPLQRSAQISLLRRYFVKLQRHVDLQASLRQEAQRTGQIAELSNRCDLLGSQLDVAVKALTTTNAAMARLAERLAMLEAGAVTRTDL